MTNKQAAMARAVANGMTVEGAAKLAGYNIGYARKKAREPAFVALVERYRAKMAEEQKERDAVETLWEIINDPGSTPQERTQAIRALIAYDRAHEDRRPAADVTIIDDIPPTCKNCPNKDNFSTGGMDDGTDRDQGPCRDDREGRPEAAGAAADAAAPQG